MKALFDALNIVYDAKETRGLIRHADAARVEGTPRGAGNHPPLQRSTLRQRLCLVLAKDRCGSHFKTSLADYRLRQLRHRD